MTEIKLSLAADFVKGVLFILSCIFICILLPAGLIVGTLSLIIGTAFLIGFI